MTEAEKFAMVFHAAADGAIAKYQPPPGARMWGPFNSKEKSADEALAGAFRAIGDMFAKIAEAEKA